MVMPEVVPQRQPALSLSAEEFTAAHIADSARLTFLPIG
jgi:hypothetical protein